MSRASHLADAVLLQKDYLPIRSMIPFAQTTPTVAVYGMIGSRLLRTKLPSQRLRTIS